MRELRIGALRDIAIGRQKRGGVAEEELRIGPQVAFEIVMAALETGRRDDGVHLRANPFHLGKTDLVNLLRRIVGRDVPLHVVRVHRGAVRQRVRRNRFAAPR